MTVLPDCTKAGKTLDIGSITRDMIDDLIHLPSRRAENTEKYTDAIKMLEQSPEITRLAGHSLGAAVVNTLDQNFPSRCETTTYATPAVNLKEKGVKNKTLDIGAGAILTTLFQ